MSPASSRSQDKETKLMTPSECGRHLVGELCPGCHVATHHSSARQRQCPRCRAKWSYHRLQVLWHLAGAFDLMSSAGRAARYVGCTHPIAAHAFVEFRGVL